MDRIFNPCGFCKRNFHVEGHSGDCKSRHWGKSKDVELKVKFFPIVEEEERTLIGKHVISASKLSQAPIRIRRAFTTACKDFPQPEEKQHVLTSTENQSSDSDDDINTFFRFPTTRLVILDSDSDSESTKEAKEQQKRKERRNRPLIEMKDVDQNDETVVYKESSASGSGVFAMRNLYPGDFVTEYVGRIGNSMMLVGNDTDRNIEGMSKTRCLGAYVNRPCTRLQQSNCFFYVDPKTQRAYIKATRYIETGSECLAKYGSDIKIIQKRKDTLECVSSHL